MLKVALVGCGFWGSLIIPKLLQNRTYHLRYLVDSNQEVLAPLAEEYGFVNVTSNLEELLTDTEIDLVFITVSNDFHFEIAKQLLRSGKSIYIEQPVVFFTEEFDELLKLAEQHRAKILVGNVNEFNEAIRSARASIESEQIGQLYYINSQRLNFVNIRNHPYDEVLELVMREVVLACDLVRESVQQVRAVPILRTPEDVIGAVQVVLQFAGGVHFNSHVSIVAPQKIRDTTIVGARKMIRIDDTQLSNKITEYNYRTEISFDHKPSSFGEFSVQVRQGDILMPQLPYSEPLKAVIDAMPQIYQQTEIATEANRNRAFVRIMEGIRASLESGQSERIVE